MKIDKNQKKALNKLHKALVRAEEAKLFDVLTKEVFRALIDRFYEAVTKVKQEVDRDK